MFAPTSTRNGACCSARGLIGTRSRSDASIACANAADCSMWRACAISQSTTSMSRLPPPRTGRVSDCASRGLLGLVAVLRQAQEEDLGAADARPQRRVRVQAEEQVGLVVVGERRALIERDGLIAFAREQHADAEPRLERRLQPSRDRQA